MSLEHLPAMELGRIGGVPIRLDVTFAIVPLALFPWRAVPDLIGFAGTEWRAVRLLILWLVQVAMVFGSLLAHEAGHAVAARWVRQGVEQIHIGGFYGLAVLRGRARSRSAANVVLLAGPLANAVIALSVWVALGMPTVSGRLSLQLPIFSYRSSPLLVPSLVWLFSINIALLVFNLLPAFPLDGGRIARNLLQSVVGSRQAVRVVAGAGILVGAWSLLGSLAYGIALATAGVLIVFVNYSIWTGELDAPDD